MPFAVVSVKTLAPEFALFLNTVNVPLSPGPMSLNDEVEYVLVLLTTATVVPAATFLLLDVLSTCVKLHILKVDTLFAVSVVVEPGNTGGEAGTNLPKTWFNNESPFVNVVDVVSVTALLTKVPVVFEPSVIAFPTTTILLAAMNAALAVFLAVWSTELDAAAFAAAKAAFA